MHRPTLCGGLKFNSRKQQFAMASRCSRSPSCPSAPYSSWWPLVLPWPADLPSSAAEDPHALYSNTFAHFTEHYLTFTTTPNTSNELRPSMRWAYSIWQPFSTSHPTHTVPNNGAHVFSNFSPTPDPPRTLSLYLLPFSCSQFSLHQTFLQLPRHTTMLPPTRPLLCGLHSHRHTWQRTACQEHSNFS